jgi:hypothetical protein
VLRLTEGITPGWGDDYPPRLEGQYLDVTNVPPGTYALVHRVDPGGRLLDASRRNNAATAMVRLDPPASAGGPPRLTPLRRCAAVAGRCP